MTGCNSCQMVNVNGVDCHEAGCPKTPRKCRECGAIFTPDTVQQAFCSEDCWNGWYGNPLEDDPIGEG